MGYRSICMLTPSPLALNGAYDRLSSHLDVHVLDNDPLLTTPPIAVQSHDQRHTANQRTVVRRQYHAEQCPQHGHEEERREDLF